MNGFRLLFLLFLLFVSKWSRGQYVFTNLRVKDGLSANEVFSICKDSEGFVWVGTSSGLNRFDGSSFKVYSRRNGNLDSVASETILSIVEYDQGKIFIGNQKGLSYFEKKKAGFTNIPFFDKNNKAIKELSVDKLVIDPQDRLWIFTLNGIYLYQSGKAVPVSSVIPSASILDNKVCFSSACQLDTINNGIWIGTMNGLFFYDLELGKVYHAANNPKNWKHLTKYAVESLSVDKRGKIWMSANEFPLACFDPSENILNRIDSINLDNKIRKVDFTSHRVFVDSKDRVWLSTWYYKVFVREPDGRYINLPDQSPSFYKLGYGFFHATMEEADGSLWIGTINGLSKLSSQNPLQDLYTVPRVSREDSLRWINYIQRYSNEELLILKDDGIFIVNERTGVSKEINKGSKHGNRYFAAARINNEWWLGYGWGMQILDPVTLKIRPFTNYPGKKPLNRSVIWIHEDRRKNIWYGVWADGIYRYNPQTGESLRFAGNDPRYGDLDYVNSLCVMEDHNGLLWFGHGATGVRVFDYATGKFSKPRGAGAWAELDNTIVNSIIEDSQHNVWIATNDKGVYCVDKERKCSLAVSTANGLSANNVITLFMDSHNILWLATPEGLHFFRPGEKISSKIDIDLPVPFGDIWSLMESGNKLYASMSGRIAVIDITAADKRKEASPPVISRISVLGKDIPFLQSGISLQLKHNQNFFVIEFSSPDHREITSMQYAYMLKGFDRDWVYPGRQRTASYTNVPDGKYTFIVKCTDANGKWIETETSMQVIIQAPFWKRWWFVLLIVFLIAGLVWQLYRLRKARQRKKNIDRTIDYFANSVYGENSVNEICWDIARNCIARLQFEDCVVYLLDEKKGKLVQKAAYGPKNPRGHEIENPIEIEPGKGIVGSVAVSGKPVLVHDTSVDERYIVDDERRFSEIAVPILHDGKVIGVIDSEHRRKNFFTAHHLKTLTTIASISSNKIAEAQAEENARQHEIKLLEINKLLAESQLMALRAQMNPHFVFNCLNSIQECIVTQKYGEASNYLNKFSKLFRMVLNNSGKNLVTVEEEKEVIKLYLELELMRFGGSFEYGIKVDEELETDEILIPSMLLQPYVENALWHGLLHKEGERRLFIQFDKLSEDVYRCVIDDNGIGRKKSFELKEQQSKTKRHESKGLKITQDRIDILNQQGYYAKLEIVDKLNEDGTTSGTRVIIELSTFLKP